MNTAGPILFSPLWRKYQKLYTSVNFSNLTPLRFLMVTDYSIYWIHRMVHLPLLYKHLHKPHHKWISQLFFFGCLVSFGLNIATCSSYTMGCLCFPPCWWLHSIHSLPFVCVPVPSSPIRIPRSVRLRQLVDHHRASFQVSLLCNSTDNYYRLTQIHDSDMITGHWLENIINGPAHHTLHHLYFTVNYGQVSL